MKSSVLVVLLLVGIRCTAPTTPSTSAFDAAIEESTRLIDSLKEARKVPGIDIAVYINGETVWSKGFGYADLEHEAAVLTGKTRFRIGSVSKPLAVAALGKLMDQGKVNLDTPIQVYVPYFPTKKYSISTRQLGGHQAGIRHYQGDEFLSTDFYATVKEGIEIFKDDPLLFEPGTAYSYSSYGFNLLSAAIEGASGEPFLPYMQREVFDALGMSDATADVNKQIIINRSSFYALDDTAVINAPYVDNSYKWAGGGFIATTTDMIKFAEGLMSAGYLSASTLEEITKPQTLKNGETTNYGIGWRTFNESTIGHTGGSVGGITFFAMQPKNLSAIVILSNSSDTRYGDVPLRILDLFQSTTD